MKKIDQAVIPDDGSFGKPPGGDVGGGAMPDRGQSHNDGFGSTRADHDRGHLDLAEPGVYDTESPQRDKAPVMKGFLNRDIISTRR